MRSVRSDQSSVTITLHYLNNGSSTLRFVLRKQEFLIPVIMIAKALINISDKEFFDRVVQGTYKFIVSYRSDKTLCTCIGDTSNTFITTRIELLLRDAKSFNIFTMSQARSYLGSLFRNFLPISDRYSDEEAGELLIQRYIFVHISSNNYQGKFECLLHMLRKLYCFAEGFFLCRYVFIVLYLSV